MIGTLLVMAVAAQSPTLLDQRRVTLLQFEIRLPNTLTAKEYGAATAMFAADTRTIRACPDAIRLATRYKAERRFTGTITQRPNVPFAALPAEVRGELARIPVGRATRVFGPKDRRRVLIACTAPQLPNGAAAVPMT